MAIKAIPGSTPGFQALQQAKTGKRAVLHFVIAGTSAPVEQTLPHSLEKVPTRFTLVKMKGASATASVRVPDSGVWATDRNVTLVFPSGGEYDIMID